MLEKDLWQLKKRGAGAPKGVPMGMGGKRPEPRGRAAERRDLCQLSLWALAGEYKKNKVRWGKQFAAAVAYVISHAMGQAGDSMGVGRGAEKQECYDNAAYYAKDCIELLQALPETAGRYTVIYPLTSGNAVISSCEFRAVAALPVMIPEYFHTGTVRARLAPWLR